MSSTLPPFAGELKGTDETGVHNVGSLPPKGRRKEHGRRDGPPTEYPNLEDTGNTGNTGKNYIYFIIVLIIVLVILPLAIFMIYSRPLQHYLPFATRKNLQGRKKQSSGGRYLPKIM